MPATMPTLPYKETLKVLKGFERSKPAHPVDLEKI